MPPQTRSAGFVMHFDPGTIPSIRERLYPAFQTHLILTLGDVVESIIANVQDMLEPLQADHVPYDNIMGGFDTGNLRNGITSSLIDIVSDGVFYELKADHADYWQWVNFGHFVNTKDGPRWWEGYHFFEKAIAVHEKAIFKAAQLAWHRAASEQSVSSVLKPSVNAALISALSASEQGG